MRSKPLKSLHLILSLSKDEAEFPLFQHPVNGAAQALKSLGVKIWMPESAHARAVVLIAEFADGFQFAVLP